MNGREHDKAISIRFPHQVWAAMRRLAQRHKRSFNGEVIWALEEYIARQRDKEEGHDE